MTRIRVLSGVAALALLAGLGLDATPSAAQGRDMRGPGPQGQDMRAGQDRMRTGNRERVTVELLYDRLQPRGEFVEIRGLGRAWKPADVRDDWRPYTNGRWIFNQRVGWYFASEEPWAEITYHYGRWYDDPNEGWVWIADTEWAPAWVEWRRTRRHVGWRPLPPRNLPRVARARERTEVVEQWVFVPAERITEERITTVIIEEEPEIRTIYREARPIGRVERRGGVTVNFALDPEVLRRESNVTIESRNLPRVEAAPVPREVEQISTETRTTTTTTETDRQRRPDGENRDTTRSRETSPTTQPPSGSATAPQPQDQRRSPADTARQPATEPGTTGTSTQTDRTRRQELERQRQETNRGQTNRGDTARPSARPGDSQADRPDEATQEQRRRQRATTGSPASGDEDARTRDQRRLQGNRGGAGDDSPAGARRPSPGQEPSAARRPASDEPRGASPGGSDRPAAARRGEDGQDPAMRRPPPGQAGRDRGPTPGQSGARGGDETTGAVRQQQSPETRRSGGGDEAKPSAGGRERGPQRRLPPGAQGSSD